MITRVGLLLYPLFIATLYLSRRGVVEKFIDARATSPDNAKTPAMVGVVGSRRLNRPLATGVLVRVGGGRYYVDLRRRRQRLIRMWIIAAAIGLALAAATAIW